MGKFKEFLKEGVSPILYHHTTVKKVLSILQKNELFFSSSLGTHSDKMYKGSKFKPYYFATSRIKYGGYARSFGEYEQVNIVLDGVKLSHNIEGKSVDYWGPGFRPDSLDVDSRLRNQENEERLFSQKPFVKNANKYIKEIHILVDKKYDMMQNDYEQFQTLTQDEKMKVFRMGDLYKDIQNYCNDYNLQCFFYSDFKAFRVLNKNKAKSMGRSRTNIALVVELFEVDTREQLSKEANSYRYDVIYNSTFDTARSLENRIHNDRGTNDNRISIEKLTKYMIKFKLRTMEDVVAYLKRKWRDIE